jgi:hypothetical protein
MTRNVNPKINIFFITHPRLTSEVGQAFTPPKGRDLIEFIFGFTKASSSLIHETKEMKEKRTLLGIIAPHNRN